MPVRKSKQQSRSASSKKQAASKKAKTVAATAPKQQRDGRSRPSSLRPKSSWKPVSELTKKFVLHTFDAGVKLVMHKVPDDLYTEVQEAVMEARNQVATSLGTLKVPPSQHNYSRMSATVTSLTALKQQLEERQSALAKTLEIQERELQALEDKKIVLQDFGKRPGKNHSLLLEPLAIELHLNFNTVK